MKHQSIESEANDFIRSLIAPDVSGIPVIPLRSDTERGDRFVAVETALMKQEAPGLNHYQLPAAIHVGTRKTGDGGDHKEEIIDEAWQSIRSRFAVRLRLTVRDGLLIDGIVPGTPEIREDEAFNVRTLPLQLFIITKKEK